MRLVYQMNVLRKLGIKKNLNTFTQKTKLNL